ncbi:M20/M25/M40 family metallo-hydrolase [Streptomyces sp. CC208A]|uniref:M20/M25/M40 family metallo-hydrolase n=1 Tax=Streptomyces sp. CC208A TaxID=3044573 RepID=UPI0024A9C9C8|nr:M20/M25/M40 family metallo-hydrolase [Streptomyces sp. CC208A]
MHVTCLLGALDLLADGRAHWAGTVTAVFQPAEEIGAGAQAMVDDGLFDQTGKPDIVLGQHVGPFPPARSAAMRAPRSPPPTPSRSHSTARAPTAHVPRQRSTRW